MPNRSGSNFAGKRQRRCRALLIGILCVFGGAALTNAESLPFKNYSTADGLAHGTILSIYQDRKGFLWFGTFEGLSMFDGYTFTGYDERDGLPNSFVNHVTEDRRGNLWIATNGGGVARLIDEPREADAAKFVGFKIREPSGEKQTLANNVNRMLFDANGYLWCLTDHGLFRAAVDDAELKFEAVIEKPSGDSLAALEDRSGRLWFGLRTELVEIRDGVVIRHGAVGKPTVSNFITSIVQNTHGTLLVADESNLFEFQPPTGEMPAGRWEQVNVSLAANNHIRTIFPDESGDLWIGTWRGLIRIDGARQVLYTTANGLSVDSIRVIEKDRAGNLWIGTEDGGAGQLISEAIVSYTRAEGIAQLAQGIFEDGAGRLWATQANRSVVEIGERQVIAHERFEGAFSASEAVVLARHQDVIWYRTSTGVTKVAGPRLRLRSSREIDLSGLFPARGEVDNFTVYEDPAGYLWLSRPDRKIYRADLRADGPLVFETLPSPPDLTMIPWIVGDGTGGLWLGAFSKIGRLMPDGRYLNITVSDGLPETDPRSFFVDSRGWLWIGSRFKGVSVTRERAAENPSFVNYSVEQGQLSSNAVRSIAEDETGRIYFATDRGLDRLDPQTGQWTHFTTRDGLAGNRIFYVMKDSRNMIWAATEGGVSRLDPRREKNSRHEAPIYLTRVQAAGENIPLPAAGADFIGPLELSASQNNLTIEFVAPGFQNQDKLFYQYRLEGVDAGWSDPTKDRAVTFARLAAGEYRFLVRAVDKSGPVSSKPAVFEFQILPAVWQRWWFMAGAAALAAGLIYLFYRNRLRRLLEIERMRTRIATDLHDDIGANLTKIAILTEVAQQRFGSRGSGNDDLLPSIAEISRESVSSMSDIVWAINPKKDHLSDLIDRMRRHAREVLEQRDIQLEFNTPESGVELKLDANRRRDIYLIFKETLNNIVRHAGSGRVRIDLEITGAEFILSLEDDGIGFNPAAEYDGNGLPGMKKRAADFGGFLDINSADGRGTRVTLRFAIR